MIDRRRAGLVLAALVGTFIVVRTLLGMSPDSDFDIAGYNIHHLFTGLVLILVAGVPLAVSTGRSRWTDLACVGFGCGLSLALDEWVYLIATDGSNASYLMPVSFWGGVIVVGIAALYLAVLWWAGRSASGGRRSRT
jgi:hypothetical protein